MSFSPFGAMHAVVLLVCGISWWALVRLGRRQQDRTRLRRGLAVSVVAINVAWTLYKMTPEHWNLDTSLPLHLCDFAWMAAGISLWLGPPRARTVHQLLYFWGLGLSPLAFLTPTLTDGPDHPYFWMFWLSHWQIVAAAVFNLGAEGIRPTWRGCGRSIVASLVLVGLVTLLNLWLDTPYCFTGSHDPENATPLDLFGPWPERLIGMVLTVSGLFALMTWIGRRRPGARLPEKE